MSATSNSFRLRRRLVGAPLLLAAWPLTVMAHSLPRLAAEGLRPWGSGEFRHFGFLVYEAELWAGDDPLNPPLALALTYRRRLSGKAIAASSVAEMRRLGAVDDATLARWGEALERLFPDVGPGDRLIGHHDGRRARFLFNERELGSVDEPGFADRFFAIWLSPETRAPALRRALLDGRRPPS